MIITFMGKGFIRLPIKEYTQVTGSIAKCTEEAHSRGPMEENTRGTSTKVSTKVMGFSHGRMVKSTMATGKTGFKKAFALFIIRINK